MTPRLKSLELHGYKTFASRTIFEFPGDVTAIVGPNGSGKSNIADSLRWVLGEQSYSLLRGRKTEDMIFSGSELRPRAGMASATITFNNEDGWLPIDFNEVSVARRAYRDGQNEYLLNGQKVRLKEIAELLSKSGLAERTYTVIGQGLVDAALSLKPEERRRFFEEAAGIGLYRARREEALSRLDTTGRNLERVLDILSELEPRMHSLEKQAKRFQEYERIRADLRLLLRDWYGYHWHRLQQDVIHAREAVKAQEARLDIARQRQLEIEERLGELRNNVLELRNALNEWHARSGELHTRWEKASRTLAVMDERCNALVNEQRRLSDDRSRLEDDLKARQARELDLAQERDRLEIEQTEAQERAAEARQNLQKRVAERAQAEQALREARRALVSAETEQVQLKAHQTELANRLEALSANKRALAAALAADSDQLTQAQARAAEKKAALQEAEAAQKALEKSQSGHRAQVAALEAQRKALQDEEAGQNAERARLSARLEVLEQAEHSLSGLASGAKFLLQEARQGRLQGAYRALSSELVVPAEYETAVAAALGEFFDGVIIQDGADAERALEALSRGEKGRAALLPLADARLPQPLPPLDDPGCLGVVSDLVSASSETAQALRLILGQALLARDRSAAKRLSRSIPVWARVVTLQGEVFHGSGAITAGLETRSGAIGRPRQIQELKDALAAAEGRALEAAERLRDADAELSRLRTAERELDLQARQAGQALSRAAQAHQQALLQVEQVRQRHEFQTKQMAGMAGQIASAEREQQTGSGELEKISRKISALNEQARACSQALNRLPVEAFQAEEAHWNTASAVAGRALKEADRRLLEHREAAEAVQRQMEGLQARIQAASGSLAALEAEKLGLREEESRLSAEIEVLRQQIEPAEEQVEIAERAYSEQQDVLTAAQQAVSVADRHVSQAQLELARLREAVESLKRRVEDDFGLVSFEYQPEESSQAPLPLAGMVEQLPDVAELSAEIEENINRQRALLRRLGPINPEVQSEYQSVKERFEFLSSQVIDLKKADADLREVITELDELMRREFRKTFDAVAAEFKKMFTRLFGGGSAHLALSDEDHPNEAGIDIEARLPGRRSQGLSLLSGGERSLTAVALIFSLLKVSPTPFCVLDEVDAMLDEANVGRFRDLLLELSDRTQFIIVTHNRNTVQAADVIYGVTMGRDSASQVISLKLDEISDEMVT